MIADSRERGVSPRVSIRRWSDVEAPRALSALPGYILIGPAVGYRRRNGRPVVDHHLPPCGGCIVHRQRHPEHDSKPSLLAPPSVGKRKSLRFRASLEVLLHALLT